MNYFEWERRRRKRTLRRRMRALKRRLRAFRRRYRKAVSRIFHAL